MKRLAICVFMEKDVGDIFEDKVERYTNLAQALGSELQLEVPFRLDELDKLPSEGLVLADSYALHFEDQWPQALQQIVNRVNAKRIVVCHAFGDLMLLLQKHGYAGALSGQGFILGGTILYGRKNILSSMNWTITNDSANYCSVYDKKTPLAKMVAAYLKAYWKQYHQEL